MELTRRNFFLLIGAGVTAFLLGAYLFLYAPLMAKVRMLGFECRSIESELAAARNLIGRFQAEGVKKTLIQENEVSLAIEELTRQGKFRGINFISMTPGPIEKPEGKTYRILPIEMQIESTYAGSGEFLGFLEALERSIIWVEAFQVTAKGPDPSKLNTKLNIHMHLAETAHE